MMLTSKPEFVNLQLYLYKIVMNLSILLDNPAFSSSMTEDAIKSIPAEGARMAVCMIAIGPIVMAYPFFQKYFVQGLTIGSVKG